MKKQVFDFLSFTVGFIIGWVGFAATAYWLNGGPCHK